MNQQFTIVNQLKRLKCTKEDNNKKNSNANITVF